MVSRPLKVNKYDGKRTPTIIFGKGIFSVQLIILIMTAETPFLPSYLIYLIIRIKKLYFNNMKVRHALIKFQYRYWFYKH